ncbi:hypothetical protein [Enemella sp. A6]|uniref:hypothetical protein n=1 Tax=Enemella sp. A6 TaxID=3440152 RepID=UPI003EB70027
MISTVLGTGTYGGIGLVGFALFAISWVAGRMIVRDVAERPARQVDEYEFVERARVRDVGYVVALAALVLGFVLLLVATKMAERGDFGLLQRSAHIVFLGFLTAAALPTVLLVWRTRDIPDNPEA